MSHRLGSGWADSFYAARLWISAAVAVVCSCVALRDAVYAYAGFSDPHLGAGVVGWWTFAAGFIFVGVLQMGAGLVALWSNPESDLARAFASFAFTSGLCLVSFFDTHGPHSLSAVLALSLAALPFAALRLTLHLPTTPQVLVRHPRFDRLTGVLGLASGLAAAWFEALGADRSRLFGSLALWLAAGLAVLVFGVAGRVVFATRAERRPLDALLFVVLPPYAALGACVALLLSGLRAPNELLYPGLVLAPVATIFAFARYDLWGSRALLSRLGTNLFLGAVAAAVAIAAGTAVATSVGVSFHDALVGAVGSGVAAAVLVAFSLRVSDVALFRSRAEYKPTIDRLSEELITLSSPSDVAHAVERTVRRWLRCEYIALTLARESGVTLANAADRGDLGTGEDEEPPCSPKASIRLAVSFGGRPYGWLDVGGKRGSALFTSDDIDLLRTIANHGGLALAHAHAYQELEDRRRRQAEAWRGEREALVETVAAEIAHEIRYPLNYFRSLFDRSAKSTQLTADDVDVGLEEVDRLERLVSGLKRMVANRTERRPTHLAELCTRVEALLRDSLGSVRLELEIGADATLSCDPDKLTQVMVNLISNAVEACGPNGRVGIAWSGGRQGGELRVWDDGPGFVGEASRLFAPWYTTKDRGTGLGLAITHRLVRAHGWTISAQRQEGRTVFAIAVSATDILGAASAGGRDAAGQARVA